MMNFMQAVVKALQRNENYDYYQEFENIFIFSINDASESIGGFDAPTLVDRTTGEITSHLELEDRDKAGWLENVIAEGSIEERIQQERPVSPTHSARYMFEHRLIPHLLYQEGIGFMGAIVGEKNILNDIFKDVMQKEGVENPYGEEAIKVEPFRIKDIIVAKIIFPEPEEEPLCYEAYALFDIENDRAGYYCLEAGGAVDDRPFLCGWSEDGVHLNYDNCSFDRDELLLNIFKLFMEYEGEDKPSLTAAYNPNKNEVEE